MDVLRALTPLLTVLAMCYGFVDALIGLRPANQWPHKEKPAKPVSPKPSQLQHTQLHSPYEIPEKVHNFTVIETELQTEGKCHTLELVRCSSLLLKQPLQNSTEVCNDIQLFTDCVLGSLRDFGRREYIIGMVLLDDLRFSVKQTFRCQNNSTSLGHLRHRVSKRYGGTCCTEGLINCAVQTFFKMSTNRPEKCQLINYYDVCMNEISSTCHSESLKTSYPVFVSQMKRLCPGHSKRRKRSKILETIFSIEK